MVRILFLLGVLWGVPGFSGNIHEQIDECRVTADADCLRAILHQLARQQPAAAGGAKIGQWCVCEDSGVLQMLYLIRTFPDGTRNKSAILSYVVPADQCTAQLLRNPECKTR